MLTKPDKSTTPRGRTAIYARVSTFDQNPKMQLREIRAYAKNRRLNIVGEFIDKASGAQDDRPALNRLWQAVKAGAVDIVLVWKFDRFARSTKHLIDALEEFRHYSVDFISLTEQIDTASPMGKAMFTIVSVIAEFERALISERIRAGIAQARAEGRPHGRPPLDPALDKEMYRLRRHEHLSVSQIADRLHIPRGTVSDHLRKQKQRQQTPARAPRR